MNYSSKKKKYKQIKLFHCNKTYNIPLFSIISCGIKHSQLRNILFPSHKTKILPSPVFLVCPSVYCQDFHWWSFHPACFPEISDHWKHFQMSVHQTEIDPIKMFMYFILANHVASLNNQIESAQIKYVCIYTDPIMLLP